MSQQLIVAIGRESGSGGLDIAHALADAPVYWKSGYCISEPWQNQRECHSPDNYEPDL